MDQNAVTRGEVTHLFHGIELVVRPLGRVGPISSKGVLTRGLAVLVSTATAAVSANWVKPKNAITRLPKSAVHHLN